VDISSGSRKLLRPTPTRRNRCVAIDTSGTLESSLHEFYRGPQFELVTLTAFSVIGLVLVVIGVFSVMGYTERHTERHT
jgi:hypothetical protein